MNPSRLVSYVCACLAVLVVTADAQPCIDYESQNPYDVPRLWDHPGYATPWQAALAGDTAYVLDEDGLKILDLSSLPDVAIEATYPSSVEYFDLVVFKERLYLATEHGLRILDITQRSTPTILDVIEPSIPFRTLLLDQGRLFAAGGPRGLIVEVAGGSDAVTAEWTMHGTTQMVRIGDVLWSTNQNNALVAHDITDPHKVGRLELEFDGTFTGDLLAVGSHLLLGDNENDGNKVSVVDVSDPFAPVLATRFGSNAPMQLDGNRLIVGDEVYDISDPVSPILVGNVTPFDVMLPTTPAVGLVAGFGWEAVDLDLPWFPVLAASGPVANDFGQASIHEGLLFASNGVWSLDAPAVPIHTAEDYSTNFYRGWDALSEGIHYQERREGVLVSDLSDPAAPRKLGMFRLPDLVANPGTSFLMSVIDGMGYYVYQGVPGFSGRPTLAVFDMGDPVYPKQKGWMELFTVFDCVDMMKVGDVLFIMTGVGSCRMVDVSDPTAPVFVGNLPGRATSTRLIRDGDLLGMAMSGWGVDLYDVSDPFTPVYTGKIPTDSPLDDAVLQGDHAFTLAGGMIHVFDISSSPFLLGSFRPPATVTAMDASPERLLVATSGGGWYAYAPDCGAVAQMSMQAEATIPVHDRSVHLSPNPFNPRTNVSWEQERPGHVTVTVHDLGGRLVATLADGERGMGRHTVQWNGTDDHGRAQATGTYMVSVRRDDRRDVRKALLIR